MEAASLSLTMVLGMHDVPETFRVIRKVRAGGIQVQTPTGQISLSKAVDIVVKEKDRWTSTDILNEFDGRGWVIWTNNRQPGNLVLKCMSKREDFQKVRLPQRWVFLRCT